MVAVCIEELKKAFIKQMLTPVLLLALLLKAFLLLTNNAAPFFDYDQSLRKDYLACMEYLEGPATPEKSAFVQSMVLESKESDIRIDEAVNMLLAGTISESEFGKILIAESEIQHRKPVVEHIAVQYEYVMENDSDRYYIDPLGWSSLLGKQQPDIILEVLALVIGVVIFYVEDDSTMSSINMSAKYGRKHLAIAKSITVFVYCLTVVSAFFGLDTIVTGAVYGLDGASYPIQSIPFYAHSTYNMSFAALLACLYVLAVLGALILASAMVLLFLISRSAVTSLVIGLSLSIFPPFVTNADDRLFRLPFPSAYLVGNGFFRGDSFFIYFDGTSRVTFHGLTVITTAIVICLGFIAAFFMFSTSIMMYANTRRGFQNNE